MKKNNNYDKKFIQSPKIIEECLRNTQIIDDKKNEKRENSTKRIEKESLETNDKQNIDKSTIFKNSKKDYENLLDILNKERKQFHENKIKEKKEFESWKANEILKLKTKEKATRNPDITVLNNKLQMQKEKEKMYQLTIDSLNKEIYNQQNIIVNLNSKLKQLEDLLLIDKKGNKIKDKEKERLRVYKEDNGKCLLFMLDEIKLKEVKAIENQFSNTTFNTIEEVINKDKSNLKKEALPSDDNSLSDIDEKRSFDERSIKLKNHVPHINKLNIPMIPKKIKKEEEEKKIDFLSLNNEGSPKEKNKPTIITIPNQFKRNKLSNKNSSNQSLSRELESKPVEKTEINCCWEMKFPEKYHGLAQQNAKIIKHEKGTEGKVILIYDNDKKEIIFPNGIRKLVFDDGYNIIYLNNKDIKQVYILEFKRLILT